MGIDKWPLIWYNPGAKIKTQRKKNFLTEPVGSPAAPSGVSNPPSLGSSILCSLQVFKEELSWTKYQAD